MHTQSALWIQRGERTKLYIDIRSIQPCILLTNMYERTIQYLPLHLIVGITMYIFYYGQFTLSVHTNLTVTDYFGSTIKTNEGHIIAWHTKDYYPTHMHRDPISYNLTQTSIKNAFFFPEKRLYASECFKMVITPIVVNISSWNLHYYVQHTHAELSFHTKSQSWKIPNGPFFHSRSQLISQ